MRLGFSLIPDCVWATSAYAVATALVLAWVHLSRQKATDKGFVAAIPIARRLAFVFSMLFAICWLLGIATWVFFAGFVVFSMFCGTVGTALNVGSAGLFGMTYIIMQFVLGFPDHDKWILSPQPARPRPPRPPSELDRLVGQTARSVSTLRPGGEVSLDGHRYAASSHGSKFIERNVDVTVVDVRSGKLIVVDESSEPDAE